MHYRGFDVHKLSDQDLEEIRFLKRLAARYAMVGVLCYPAAVILVMTSVKRIGWALLLLFLGSAMVLMAGYYNLKAQEIMEDD